MVLQHSGAIDKLGCHGYQLRPRYDILRIFLKIGDGFPQTLSQHIQEFFSFHLSKDFFNPFNRFVLHLIKTLPAELQAVLSVQELVAHLADHRHIRSLSNLHMVRIRTILRRVKGIRHHNLLSRMTFRRGVRKVMSRRIQ